MGEEFENGYKLGKDVQALTDSIVQLNQKVNEIQARMGADIKKLRNDVENLQAGERNVWKYLDGKEK